jgi:hypothetical protein
MGEDSRAPPLELRGAMGAICEIGAGSVCMIEPISEAWLFPRTRAAGRHLVEHAAERPDVAARVGLLAFELLGRHVLERADDGALGGERLRDGRRLGEPAMLTPLPPPARPPRARAEVHQLGAALREHDVAGLEIAVDDAGAVRAIERVGDLRRAATRPAGQRTRVEPLRPASRLDQLHHEIVGVALAADVVQRADVGWLSDETVLASRSKRGAQLPGLSEEMLLAALSRRRRGPGACRSAR